MNQDELNKELDHFLEEGIFNGDLDNKDVDLIRKYLCSMVKEVDGVEITEEQWLYYASHCTISVLRDRFPNNIPPGEVQ